MKLSLGNEIHCTDKLLRVLDDRFPKLVFVNGLFYCCRPVPVGFAYLETVLVKLSTDFIQLVQIDLFISDILAYALR